MELAATSSGGDPQPAPEGARGEEEEGAPAEVDTTLVPRRLGRWLRGMFGGSKVEADAPPEAD
jgi:hypothetical protein